jgi:hypothetical protein
MRQWLLTIFILIFFVQVLSVQTLAQEVINFVIERNLITYDGKFKVTFDIDSAVGKDYYVRPKLNNGNIHVFNPKSNNWVKSGGVWTDMPKLDKELFLRISSLEQKQNILSFEFLDVNTGEISESSERTIYGKRVYDNYIDSVNMSLKNVGHINEPEGEVTPMQAQTDTGKNLGISKSLDPGISSFWLYIIAIASLILLLPLILLLKNRTDRSSNSI